MKIIKKKNEKKHFIIKQEVFVNVFDFIFTVKSIQRNEIVLYINDISNVLDNYSKPDTFIELLNYPFGQKTAEDIEINWDIIEKYVNENP